MVQQSTNATLALGPDCPPISRWKSPNPCHQFGTSFSSSVYSFGLSNSQCSHSVVCILSDFWHNRCMQSLLSFRKFSAWINPMRYFPDILEHVILCCIETCTFASSYCGGLVEDPFNYCLYHSRNRNVTQNTSFCTASCNCFVVYYSCWKVMFLQRCSPFRWWHLYSVGQAFPGDYVYVYVDTYNDNTWRTIWNLQCLQSLLRICSCSATWKAGKAW